MNARVKKLVESGYMNVDEVRVHLGLKARSSVYELVKAGVLSHGTHKGRIVIPRQAVYDYCAQRLVLGSVA